MRRAAGRSCASASARGSRMKVLQRFYGIPERFTAMKGPQLKRMTIVIAVCAAIGAIAGIAGSAAAPSSSSSAQAQKKAAQAQKRAAAKTQKQANRLKRRALKRAFRGGPGVRFGPGFGFGPVHAEAV